jgi:nucleolar protein 9
MSSRVTIESADAYIFFTASSSPPEPKADDFFPSLFRDTTGSHLAQAILTTASEKIFDILWRLHLVGKIGKLATHPIANFVVSTGVKRSTEEQMQRVIDELKAVDPSTLIRQYTMHFRFVKGLED